MDNFAISCPKVSTGHCSENHEQEHYRTVLENNVYILSKSYMYNATVFYFHLFSRACIKPFISPILKLNQSSILYSYCTIVLRICFQLFEKQTILWR